MTNILVGEISSYKAIVICRFIKTYYQNVTILSYDTRQFTKNVISKYSDKHFLVSNAHFEEELQHIIFSNKVDYFFPVINDSLSKLWNNKTQYVNTLNYLGEIETYNILNDKVLLHKLAMELGLQVPTRYNSFEEAKFPFVIKPTNLSSAKGVIYVNSDADIPDDIKYNQLIIQQYVEGIGVGYSFYCKNGAILNGYGHRRLAECPISGGSSTYREGYKNQKMVDIASKIVGYLNYTGFAMFEYKLTPKTNDIYLIEVNPRIWGSINQGLVNGVNYFEGILGKLDNPIKREKKELKTYLSPLVYISLIRYILRFQFKPVIYFFKNIFINTADVSIINDTKGYLSLVLRKIS